MRLTKYKRSLFAVNSRPIMKAMSFPGPGQRPEVYCFYFIKYLFVAFLWFIIDREIEREDTQPRTDGQESNPGACGQN